MRILSVFSKYQFFGGEEAAVARIGAALSKHHEMAFFDGSTSDMLGTSPLDRMLAPLKVIHNWQVSRTIRLKQKQKPFDLWLVHNVFPGFSPSLYGVARNLGVPIVQYLHSYRLSCANGFFFNHGELCTRCINGNFTYAFRTACWKDSRAASGVMGLALTRVRAMDVYRQVRRWIAISHAQKQLYEKMGVPAEKISVIHHFVPEPAAPPPFKENGAVLFLGRLSKEKGAHVLLEAWKKFNHPTRRLMIAGEGPEEESLKKYAQQNSLRNIEFVGFVTEKQQRELWADVAVMVVPSVWYETFGMVVLEAWSNARPIIVSRIGSLPELVQDDVTGKIFAVGDAASLASALNDTFANIDQAEEMGRAGYERVCRDFSEQIWTEKILKTLDLKDGL
ncbi:MAG: glycosyltransferase family 4 protein [Verrucomicrobia bacterium]|nr:glycosyltransferase family 4 protein [Verrucomicrobiota bacterium]